MIEIGGRCGRGMYTPRAMQCPSCRAKVPDDVVVCPQCDAVVDPSLLNLEPGPSTSKPARSGARRSVRKGATGKKRKADPSGPDPTPPQAGQGDWRSKVSEEDWQAGAPGQAPPAAEPNVEPMLGVEAAKYRASLDDQFISDAKTFMSGLSVPDKFAFFGAVGMAMACFFPWKETVIEGEQLGLLGYGALVFLLAAVVMTTIAVRTTHTWPKLNPLFIWVAQLGTVSLSVLWALVCIKLSWDSTLARATVGNEEIWVSKPSFGAFLGLGAGVVASLGTVLGLKEVSLR